MVAGEPGVSLRNKGMEIGRGAGRGRELETRRSTDGGDEEVEATDGNQNFSEAKNKKKAKEGYAQYLFNNVHKGVDPDWYLTDFF